jgi:hypothetical protein
MPMHGAELSSLKHGSPLVMGLEFVLCSLEQSEGSYP